MTDAPEVRILQLYPDELGVTGDAGNVTVLRTRLERSGHSVKLDEHRPGQLLDGEPDIVVIGNGPLSAIRRVHDDLLANKRVVREWARRVPFFAVGAGLELLCSRIEDPSGTWEGLGLVSATAHRGRPRRVGYVIAEVPGRDGGGTQLLTGFEDQATELAGTENAFATIVRDVTGAVSRQDGVQTRTITGTLLQGPLLPLNPWLADDLASAAGAHAGVAYVPDPSLAEFDRLAERATERMRAHVSSVFTSIR